MAITIPSPPRLTGNPKIDVSTLEEYTHQLYNALIVDAQLADRLDRIEALGQLDLTISATPTQSEVESVRDKLNAVIAAASIQ